MRDVELKSTTWCFLVFCNATWNSQPKDDLCAQKSSQQHNLMMSCSVQCLVDACSRGDVPVPDLLVNNAGLCIKGTSRDVLERTLASNFHGPERMMRMFLPLMRKRAERYRFSLSILGF